MISHVYDGNIHPDEWLKQFNTALKVDASFTIFIKEILKYKSANVGGDTAKFIDTFHEQKQYFIETLPFVLKNKFLDKIDDIKSLNDIFLRFNNLLIEPTFNIFIKNGSIIALRHVVTGKYLSTNENLRYLKWIYI
ncbi:hypothetical protein C1646_768794 [Rhizophagus diaphanus]|nr:hypothetical protein C1646_768794 [Rhizophagus diaphanus] [Rhizophagus sp. MUCL 43196]